MGKRTKLDVSEQQEVVLMLLRREEPAGVLAKRYGISEATLYHWRDKFLQGGRAALANGVGKADSRARQIQELERALAEQDRVVGDWTPDEPLAQLHEGLHGPRGTIVRKEFELTAPSKPGRYRIRWVYPMAFKPIPSFYSQENRGAHDPGNAWWSEVVFHVQAPQNESASAGTREDQLLTRCQEWYISPGVEGISKQEGPTLRLNYWNLPPTVRPGEKVRSSMAWETLGNNPNAVVFATVFGDWTPDEPLAQLHEGLHGPRGTIVRKEFEFTAPSKPGRYRIRWVYPMAFKPIPSFYSQENRGAHDPGNAWWSEVVFHVQAPQK